MQFTAPIRSGLWGAVLAVSGCYEGVALPLGGQADSGIELEDPPSDDPSSPPDDPDDGVPEADEAPAPGLRLLSSHEYENTVRDLLTVAFDNQVFWSDAHTGFDNGALAQLDEASLALLILQSEDAATRYVEERLALEYPCFEQTPLSDGCLDAFIEGFGLRAFRRTPSVSDRAAMRAFVDALSPESPTNAEVAQWMVTRFLLSPKFLYRVEGGRVEGDAPERVDDFDRASLIAYTITGSMPDELLLADAGVGALDESATAAHVRRLAQTPRGRAHMLRFASQWFRVGALARMRDTPEEFTKLPTPELGASYAVEFDTFIEGTLLGGGTLRDLMLSTAYAVDQNTAPLYGVEPGSGPGMTPTPAPEGRRGVLGLASVLAAHASGALTHRDKPIARGLLIKNQLLCSEVGLPSGIDINQAAEEVQEDVEDFDEMTSRQQLELIMNQGDQCIACHQTFMPYGFLSSNFDALGQYQTHFGARALDPRVEGLALDGETADYADLDAFVPRLAESDDLARCYVEKVARFVTGVAHSDLEQRLVNDFEGFAADEVMLDLFEQMLLHPALYERNPS